MNSLLRFVGMDESARLHRLRTGPFVYGFLLHLAVLIIAILGGLMFAIGGVGVWVLLAAGVVSVFLPRAGAAWVVMMVLVFAMLLHEPHLGRTAVMILLVHLLHLLGALSISIHSLSRVQLRALWPIARRFVIVQAAAQGLLLAALFIFSANEDAMPWLAPVGALALLVLSAFLASRAVD